ncbi:hypothetical protein [Natrinema gelatinilyticum]|nr:hypothetical protein [Natrinema gelatinilyticum]
MADKENGADSDNTDSSLVTNEKARVAETSDEDPRDAQGEEDE